MNEKEQGIYMMLLMSNREDEAIAYRDRCNAAEPSRNYALATGKVYTNRNGNDYLCKAIREPGCYIMERIKDGWTLEAHIITMYRDGTIEWDYSTGGHWAKRFEVWKDCELGGTYLVKSFRTYHEAYEWMALNEEQFIGWHLRIVEK